MNSFEHARQLLQQFKGNSYLYGVEVLEKVGIIAASVGTRATIVYGIFPGVERYVTAIRTSVERAGVQLVAEIEGAQPNAPREDLFRITEALKQVHPDVIISFGGGSTIDATKAAEVLRTLGGSIEDHFGTGLVTTALQKSGQKVTPHCHPDGGQFRGAFDQILQHHRRPYWPEKADHR